MKKLLILISFMLVCLGLIAGDALTVWAQDITSEEFTLEEIMVTAQKREENQQKVGIAMEVFSGDELREFGRTDIDQILSQISTAFISRTEEGLRVQLRGVGFDTPAGYGFGTGAVPATVAVNIDGIFAGRRPTGTGLYDIERVEVLFGPQSTMYAANTPGGIVNIETARPKLETYEASGTLEYGNYNLLHTEGVLNAPMGETLALRAGFNTTVRDGYLSNGGDDEDSKSARLRALWRPNDKFSLLVTGEYETATSRGMTGVPGFIDQDSVDDPWDTDQDLTGTPTKQPKTKINGQIDIDFGFAALTLIPSKTDEDYDTRTEGTDRMTGAATTGTVGGWGYEEGLEARMTSSEDSVIKWVAGVNYYKSEMYRESVTDYSTGEHYQTDHQLLLKQKAVLANLTYPLTDRFRLVGGARYSKDRAMSARIIVIGTPFDTSTLSDMTEDSPDFKAGIEYDINEDSMLFANWSTSYRVEQEAMNWRNEAYDPQEMTAYTAGYKSRFYGNKLQVNSSAYYYEYKNRIFMAMEMTYIDPVTGMPGPYVEGASNGPPDEGGRAPGNMRMYGADIQTSAILSRNDKVDLSVSYLDSWVKELVFDYQWLEDKDYGNRTPTYSPEWTISLDYSHNFRMPNGGVLTARYDTRYQSEYIIEWKDSSMGNDYSGYRDQEAHHIDNLGLVYAHPDGKWTLSGYVKNVWNYAEKRFMNAMAGIYMNLGPPRTYGGVLTVKF